MDHVARVLAEATAQGMAIGERLGGGSYCEAWAVGDALVLRVPRVLALSMEELTRGYGPLTGDYVSPTGPFELVNIESAAISRELFEASIDRLRGVDCPVLARLVDRFELAGTPVSLHERAPGRALATMDLAQIRPLLPAIARAVLELHTQIGVHGDLKPAHVFVDGERVTFIDPLPIASSVTLFGSYGYTLPVMPRDPTNPRDDGWLIRDVISLAAIIAESYGADLELGPLGEQLMNLDNGRFGRGYDPAATLTRLRHATSVIPDPPRTWIEGVYDTALGFYRPVLRPLRPGTAAEMLTAAFR